jgi:DNA mismatch endonuclease, patch repair protein
MSDTFTPSKRSEIMRKVKSNLNESTEIKMIQIFRKHKIHGWRRKYKLFGNPDFVFPNYTVAVFTDGCFWHGHDCRNTKPETNKEYWNKKINNNKNRDKTVNNTLKKENWTVIRIWECEIKKEKVNKILKVFKNLNHKKQL